MSLSLPEIHGSDEVVGSWNGFSFEVAEERHHPQIFEHIREQFCKDEVTGKSLGYSEALATSDEIYSSHILREGTGMCLVSVHEETGKLAGLQLACVLRRADKHLEDDRYDEQFRKILALLAYVETQGDLFGRYGVDEVFELSMTSVDSQFRGRGLAPELVRRSLRLGHQHGLKVACAICTGLYSQKVMAKLGMEGVFEVKYEDYRPNGEVVFTNTHPHICVKLMARDI